MNKLFITNSLIFCIFCQLVQSQLDARGIASGIVNSSIDSLLLNQMDLSPDTSLSWKLNLLQNKVQLQLIHNQFVGFIALGLSKQAVQNDQFANLEILAATLDPKTNLTSTSFFNTDQKGSLIPFKRTDDNVQVSLDNNDLQMNFTQPLIGQLQLQNVTSISELQRIYLFEGFNFNIDLQNAKVFSVPFNNQIFKDNQSENDNESDNNEQLSGAEIQDIIQQNPPLETDNQDLSNDKIIPKITIETNQTIPQSQEQTNQDNTTQVESKEESSFLSGYFLNIASFLLLSLSLIILN